MEISTFKAQHLWRKTFGECQYANDFVGRLIDYDEYNNYSSKYGWTVMPLIPEKKGGDNHSYNLVCCHLDTMRERGDHHPMFTANGIRFEIINTGRRYEVTKRVKEKTEDVMTIPKVDFLDAASGVQFFKALKGIQNKPRFVGTILIRMRKMKSTAVVDFIEKYFETENISFCLGRDYAKSETQIFAKDYNLPYQEDTQLLLNKCITLNTYMQNYFLPLNYVEAYDIFYRCDFFQEKTEMYIESQDLSMDKFVQATGNREELHNGLFISQNVVQNTSAGNNLLPSGCDDFTAYNGTYSLLAEELEEEAKRDR